MVDFSIIMPVLSEEGRINAMIEHVRGLRGGDVCEIIVVDGDSGGATITAVCDDGVLKMTSGRGRGCQMNAGAAKAKGEVLVFLHADTLLPIGAFGGIAECLGEPAVVGGAFDLEIDSQKLLVRVIAFFARLRSRMTRVPYGDQVIFIRRSYFEQIGGYKEIPLMEDVDLMRRIKKLGDKICILSERVRTSARRWEAGGAIGTTAKNQLILFLYYIGVKPEKFAKIYWGNYDKEES